ncbi:neurophysin 1-like isoform X1 [Panonychus citri]|uniref:neurophysin 1-like isoform X1 n=1 Tax=Panonychus citri TaxID=50023 RepID=UPI0023075264|nr:neurophysin 1-like isoform X1 [Panonychus citri]
MTKSIVFVILIVNSFSLSNCDENDSDWSNFCSMLKNSTITPTESYCISYINKYVKADKCLRCGPGNKGHCVNSNVCCGSDFGCLINNHYSAPCRAENFIPIPCKVPGKLCSSGQGVCVSNGICCSSGGCFNDLTCESDTPTNDESIQRIFDSQSSHTIQI